MARIMADNRQQIRRRRSVNRRTEAGDNTWRRQAQDKGNIESAGEQPDSTLLVSAPRIYEICAALYNHVYHRHQRIIFSDTNGALSLEALLFFVTCAQPGDQWPSGWRLEKD
jgi:hypothetical protein